MTEAKDAAHEGSERRGWFVEDSVGNRSYFADDSESASDSAGPDPASDPHHRFDSSLQLELDPEEVEMLVHGLSDWGGPANASHALAVAMGYVTVDQMLAETQQLIRALRARRPLSVRDWTRALVATEFAFVSEVFGTGPGEWRAINGGTDAHWLNILQRLQTKLPGGSNALPD